MVKRIRFILLLVLLQAVTGLSVLYAQSITSASGIVKDSITGEPLAFVSVYFDGSTIGAMTDISQGKTSSFFWSGCVRRSEAASA